VEIDSGIYDLRVDNKSVSQILRDERNDPDRYKSCEKKNEKKEKKKDKEKEKEKEKEREAFSNFDFKSANTETVKNGDFNGFDFGEDKSNAKKSNNFDFESKNEMTQKKISNNFFDFEFDDKKKKEQNNTDLFDFGNSGNKTGIQFNQQSNKPNSNGIKLSNVTQDLLNSTPSNSSKTNNTLQFSKGQGNKAPISLLEGFSDTPKEKIDTKSALNQIDLSLLCGGTNNSNKNIQNQNPNSADFQPKFQNWPDFSKDQNNVKKESQNKNLAFDF